MKKKYYELYKTIRAKILNGEYTQGEKLPSKRAMSDMTGYSVVTVQTAYAMLVDEGYVRAKEKSGYFVCNIDAFTAPSDSAPTAPFEYVVDATDRLECDLEYSLWFRTVRKVIADEGERLFARSPRKGCAVLRNAIADYLLRYRGMYAEPQRIVIGSGSEQLYENVVRLIGRDKIFGIEKPSYRQIEAVYEGMGTAVKHLKMGKDGILSEELDAGGFDVLHVTPFHSYPSGATATATKRYEYLTWAKSNGNYIVEDDFDSEFFLPGQPIESLYSMSTDDTVIYINTFSKSLSPSMRMGYMILPEGLMSDYDDILGHFSCTVPVLEQYVLAEFIKSGDFERHLRRMRRRMKR